MEKEFLGYPTAQNKNFVQLGVGVFLINGSLYDFSYVIFICKLTTQCIIMAKLECDFKYE